MAINNTNFKDCETLEEIDIILGNTDTDGYCGYNYQHGRDGALERAYELGVRDAIEKYPTPLPVLNEGTIPNSYYMQAPEFTGYVGERRGAPRGDVARAATDAVLNGAELLKEIAD